MIQNRLKVQKRAIAFAAAAHRGQVRKYVGTPYIEHPIAVANMVRIEGATNGWDLDTIDKAITVAILHDVVEDTEYGLNDIGRYFGKPVMDGVWYLTDDPRGPRNRYQHKLDIATKLQRAPSWVQTIKVCDLVHNTETITDHDPKFARLYMAEKAHLLMHLRDASPGIHHYAWSIIRQYDKRLHWAALYGAGLKKLMTISGR